MGWTRDGYYVSETATIKNDQRPAVYWRRKALTGSYSGWEVYEYWIYYPDNDWINNHEHDWEYYNVYFQNGILKVAPGVRESAWSLLISALRENSMLGGHSASICRSLHNHRAATKEAFP